MIFEYVEDLVTYLLREAIIVTVEVIILEDNSPPAFLISSFYSAGHVILLCSV